jgi:hypothetical protein
VVGSITAVLDGRRRAVAAGTIALVILVYYETSTHLWHAGIWADVIWLALVVIPVVFSLVGLAVVLSDVRWAVWAGFGFALLDVVLTLMHADVFANFTRLAAATFIAFWFLDFFETLSWVVLVASIIPWVDAYSVWRGPTKSIVAHHAHVFTVLSFAFPVPGKHAAANLGIPDLFFFALFLAASRRFGLRVGWTWLCLVAALGGTIALTVWWNVNGLPALPGISLGFLVPNADLIWHRLRRQPGAGDRPNVAIGRAADDG